ncbi:hypothetical protein ALP29_200888 [Pseudomonas syringae pv. avii]|uniref:Uncharacterized protein n=1 Tax=Pseudomonas syringae pv. avii TaxID=663959 RepID=A0A3M5UKZ8_PSESX|nr:hypothetical protein ALP29_200888 [Pseudomonas syringae pv. avii]
MQEVHCAAFIAFEGVIEFATGGADEHNRDALGLFGTAHHLGQFKAVHAGHLYVKDGQGKFVLQQQRQRLVRRQRLVDDAIGTLDQRFERQQVFRQIVNDKQFCLNFT